MLGYCSMPGGRLLFGSFYPFRTMAQTIEDFLRLFFCDEVLDSVLFENAKRLLRLDI